jgi:tetratricopeptide (TPR) repeat protein
MWIQSAEGKHAFDMRLRSWSTAWQRGGGRRWHNAASYSPNMVRWLKGMWLGIAAMSTVVELMLERGARAWLAGRPADAVRAYGEVLPRTDATDRQLALAGLNRGLLRSAVGDVCGAFDDWSMSVELAEVPGWVLCRAWLARGNLRQSAEGDAIGAICDYSAVVDRAGKIGTTQLASLESKLAVGQKWSPLEMIAAAKSHRGFARFYLGDEEGAMEDLLAVIAMEGVSRNVKGVAYANLAEAMLLRGQWDRAIEAAGQCLANEPKIGAVRCLRALAQLGKKELAEAITEFQTGLEKLSRPAGIEWCERALKAMEARHGPLHGAPAIRQLLEKEKARFTGKDNQELAQRVRRMNLRQW